MEDNGMKWCVDSTVMYCNEMRKWYGCEKCPYYKGTEYHFGEKFENCGIRHPYTWPAALKAGDNSEKAADIR